MACKGGNLPDCSRSIPTSTSLPQPQEGKIDPCNLICAILANKSALDMLKSGWGPKANTNKQPRAIKGQPHNKQSRLTKHWTQRSLLLNLTQQKKHYTMWQSLALRVLLIILTTKETTDTEAYAPDDITSAACWSASKALYFYLELVAGKPLCAGNTPAI